MIDALNRTLPERQDQTAQSNQTSESGAQSAGISTPSKAGQNDTADKSCTRHFLELRLAFHSNLSACLSDSRLMKSLTDMTDRSSDTDVDAGFARASAPDLFASVDPLDPRWIVTGDEIRPNCRLPMTVSSQNESFLECARIYLCGSEAASCGLKQAMHNKAETDCLKISRSCIARHPVPQVVQDPPRPEVGERGSPVTGSPPPPSQSTITGTDK